MPLLSSPTLPHPAAPVLSQARDRLHRAIAGFRQQLNSLSARSDPALQGAIAAEIDLLNRQRAALDQGLLRAAVFGLVSRGKSALINALTDSQQLATGPINGVTRSPQAVRWRPEELRSEGGLGWELIDTPGLDEVAGETRAAMAQTVARQADLILFVVTGDVTRKEYQAIRDLWQFQKPLLLVFNKIDLYPPPSRAQIVSQLQRYFQGDPLMQAEGMQAEASGKEGGESGGKSGDRSPRRGASCSGTCALSGPNRMARWPGDPNPGAAAAPDGRIARSPIVHTPDRWGKPAGPQCSGPGARSGTAHCQAGAPGTPGRGRGPDSALCTQ
ncbi:MAG: hypothetical protein HC824_12150 [Synechococcales cyanobacterium RM1_1_8]|nr:hypothetical protein [Synechococcales cyanobacterium RM1_1_8]